LQPALDTERLTLRPFTVADAADVRRLAGDKRVSETTAAVPHPYPEGVAEAWIATHAAAYDARTEAAFAVTRRDDGTLVGAMSLLGIDLPHRQCEVGYWIGFEFWGRGYASEALRRIVAFAHRDLGLTRIFGRCLAANPASGHVMRNAGLQPEGRLLLHGELHGRFDDVLLFGWVAPERFDRA
jgi:[ribosomal protein S5]-alanine N-acetyltransferase